MKEWIFEIAGGLVGTPQLSASFSLALFGAVFSRTCSHKEAQHRPSSTQPPLRHPVAPGERELYAGAPGFFREPEAAGDGNCWPSRLAVANGFWQGGKWTQWVTLPFPVTPAFYSPFTILLSQPAFIYCPCLPARITSILQ